MKKGFTLIELLAVIVILAIIALIATPIVLSIISDSKESANLRSAEMYLSAVEYGIADTIMNNKIIPNGTHTIMENGNICIGTYSNKTCTGDIIEVEVNGEVPSEESTITIEEGKIKDINLLYGDKTIIKDSEGNLVYKVYTSLSNYKHQHIDGTVENHEVIFDESGHGTCLKCGEGVLASGLYKEDGSFVSWQQLTSKEYKTITYQAVENGPTLTCAIINVDENGVLEKHIEWKGGINVASLYLDGVKLVIDDSVTSLGSGALMDASLTEIIISDSITSLDGGVIYNNLKLKSITIPKSITSIKTDAFSKSPYIDTINYNGSKAEWEAIEKESYWLEMNYQDVTIKCTDGNIIIPAN